VGAVNIAITSALSHAGSFGNTIAFDEWDTTYRRFGGVSRAIRPRESSRAKPSPPQRCD
jgi:hypothetical protein